MQKWLYPGLIILLFLAQFLFISPVGEFALNDDWVHTEILKHWLDTGEFRMNPFAGATFYLPIVYGIVLVKLFGFSFTLLRISTLVFALATLLVLHNFLNKINHKPHLNFFIVLALWLNPIFYSLSFTFMTDIPALFFLTCSLVLYYQAFEERKPEWILLGSIISVLGFFIRQTNIFVMVAAGIYALYELIKNSKLPSIHTKHIPLKHLAWSFGIPTLIWSSLYYLLAARNLIPDVIGLHEVEGGFAQTGEHIIWWSWYTLVYLGFFALPFCISYISKKPLHKIKNGILLICMLIPIILAIIFKLVIHVQFPYILNIVVKHGIGPIQNVIRGSLVPLFSDKIWGVATLVIAASSGYILYILGRKKIHEKPIGFIYICASIYLIPILLVTSFDRYYLPVFVVISIVLARHINSKKYSIPALTLVLVVLACFSLSQTKFYLAWNHARFELADRALARYDVHAFQIDGGYEWNGWNSYWSAYEATQGGTPHGRWTGPWWIRSVFVNNTEEYVVSFSPIEGYETRESKKIKGWNPNNTLYLLHKQK